MTFFNCSTLKCISMSNQERKVKAAIMNINSDEPSFYCDSILVNKCSGSCNNINDPYAKLCVPDVVKNKNIKTLLLLLVFIRLIHCTWFFVQI